jgi:hypothetical protein
MLKRRSTWLGGTGAMLLVLSLSGVVAAATVFTAATGPAPAAEPLPIVDTTATFVDIDGNGIDDACQAVPAVAADQTVIDAEIATVDLNADGVISTTEAAHSARIGGANCNHGGYVSWIAQHKHDCVVAPTEPIVPVVQPVDAIVVTAETDETETPDATEPDADAPEADAPEADACSADSASITGAKKDKVAAAAARAASKAERTLARETAKAERTAARTAAKAERTAAREAAKAERAAARNAAKAARAAAHAAKAKNHSH